MICMTLMPHTISSENLQVHSACGRSQSHPLQSVDETLICCCHPKVVKLTDDRHLLHHRMPPYLSNNTFLPSPGLSGAIVQTTLRRVSYQLSYNKARSPSPQARPPHLQPTLAEQAQGSPT